MAVKMDLSNFLAILIMAIGCLVVILVVNVIIIVSNPENVQITSLFRGAYEDYNKEEGAGESFGQPKYGNVLKDPFYVDVYNDRLVIYPRMEVVTARDLETGKNHFEELLNTVEPIKDKSYIIMVLRPKSARLARLLRRSIRSRGIDVGQELDEADRKLPLLTAEQLEAAGTAAPDQAEAAPAEPADDQGAAEADSVTQ